MNIAYEYNLNENTVSAPSHLNLDLMSPEQINHEIERGFESSKKELMDFDDVYKRIMAK